MAKISLVSIQDLYVQELCKQITFSEEFFSPNLKKKTSSEAMKECNLQNLFERLSCAKNVKDNNVLSEIN